jgi:hypothetical protein
MLEEQQRGDSNRRSTRDPTRYGQGVPQRSSDQGTGRSGDAMDKFFDQVDKFAESNDSFLHSVSGSC